MAVVNTEIIQIIANAARGFTRNLQEGQRLALQREQFKANQQEAEQNLKLREENLKLEQEKLALAREKETGLERERQSKQKARDARTSQGEVRNQISAMRARASIIRTLNPQVRTRATNLNRELNDRVKAQGLEPFTLPDGTEFQLDEFNGMDVGQVAREFSARQKALSGVDEFDRLEDEDTPGGSPKMNNLRLRVQAAENALMQRRTQWSALQETLGPQSADQATIGASSALMSEELLRSLGELEEIEQGGQPPPGGQDIEEGSRQTEAPTTTTPAPDQAAKFTPQNPVETMLLNGDEEGAISALLQLMDTNVDEAANTLESMEARFPRATVDRVLNALSQQRSK